VAAALVVSLGTDWDDFPDVLSVLGMWSYAFVCAGIVVLVVEIVRRIVSPPERRAGSDSSTHPGRPT
jgi:hypothetical protein